MYPQPTYTSPYDYSGGMNGDYGSGQNIGTNYNSNSPMNVAGTRPKPNPYDYSGGLSRENAGFAFSQNVSPTYVPTVGAPGYVPPPIGGGSDGSGGGYGGGGYGSGGYGSGGYGSSGAIGLINWRI
jgi:hypothetical protein